MLGYDMLPANRQLLLDLQFREYSGLSAFDHSKAHHELTLHGTPVWRQLPNDLDYLDFEAGNPDWLDCPAGATADLDFTAGAFTLALWLNCESVGFRYLMCRGLTDTDGWEWAVDPNSALGFRSNQAGAHQGTTSANGVVTIGAWRFLAMTRSGAVVRPYVDGVARLGTAGTHINPLTSARELHVGIADSEAAGFLDGAIWRPRIWARALMAQEIARIFNAERGLFGV